MIGDAVIHLQTRSLSDITHTDPKFAASFVAYIKSMEKKRKEVWWYVSCTIRYLYTSYTRNEETDVVAFSALYHKR